MKNQVIIDEQLLQAFVFYAAINLFKMSLMTGLTSLARIKRKVFANPEDAAAFGVQKVIADDPIVERIRRCHRNDMENIYVFVLLGLLYCFTSPSYTTAVWIFRIFTISRISHTFIYLNATPQPSRFLIFVVGFVACSVMVVQIIRFTYA